MLAWRAWRPDLLGPNGGYAAIADNVLPQAIFIQGAYGLIPAVGYGPFPQLAVPAPAGTALSGPPRGMISLTLFDGSTEVFAATAATIEKLDSAFSFGTTIDIGRTVPDGYDVSFLHFGEYLLNIDLSDGLKAYNVETPATNDAVTTAPAGTFIFSCNNVVFLLNGLQYNSSGLGDHTEWVLKGANGGTLTDGGALQCGFDLKNGVAILFQLTAMRIVQFGNAVSPALYSINKAADGRGTVGPRAAIAFDGTAYYLATDGFYKFNLSSGNVSIGSQKVNSWFLKNADNSKFNLIRAALDPKNKIVYWSFFSKTNTSSIVADRIICYAWELDEFFTLTVNTTALSEIATPGYTLDAMDAFGTLDAMTQIPLDDRFWQGSQPVFGALDSTYHFGTFSGQPMAATLQSFTANTQLNTIEWEATPISDNPNAMLALGVSRKLSDALTWKTPRPKVRGGKVKLRGHGLNVAFQETHAAGDNWTFSNGVDYPGASQGGST